MLQSHRDDLQDSIEMLSTVGATPQEASETAELVDTLRVTLAEIDDAISRLANGTFGSCETCKQAIADERLDELPAARHCFECADAESSVISADRDVE